MSLDPDDTSWYVYIVQCCDDSLYTGITTNIEARITQHNRGKGAKYTRSRCPVTLVYTENSESRSTALQREIQIKKMTPQQKHDLVAGNQ
ncbi:MAG: GIY-YIG nuclease family protein [Arenicellales bacterium]